VTTKTGGWSPVTISHRKVATGEHKIRKVFTREHLSTALMSTPLARRVHWAAASVYKVPVFG